MEKIIEMREKLEKAQVLLTDVYHWGCENNEHVQSLMNCADGCAWEATGLLDKLIKGE